VSQSKQMEVAIRLAVPCLDGH